MNHIVIFLYLFAILSDIRAQDTTKTTLKYHVLNSEQVQDIIRDFKPFFKEAFAQQVESFKLRKDSQTGLLYIDFCEYPPDRSLIFGALENGRFKGEKISDLPFACNETSGAKKYFFYNKDIEQSFAIMRKLKSLAFLPKNPSFKNEIIKGNQGTTTILWKENSQEGFNRNDSSSRQLWILYRNEALEQSCTIIFTQKDIYTEIILQYVNYP